MTAFDYLSVLLSIVLGLAITQLLAGFAALVRARGRMAMYWPVPVQMAAVFLISVQLWWALFPLHEMRRWTFAHFFIVLMQPVSVYMMAAFITPDLAGEGRFDLREIYFRERPWYFGSILLALAVSLVKNVLVSGGPPNPLDMAGHAVFAAAALTGLASRSDAVHKALAPATLLLYAAYIALLFVNLPG
ncbi:MAG TPA: hypothetical protein VMH86_00400 [Rhizomicrobium sp.]|nr:hypothetical protein [Rhizomicrobium sp.]